MRPNVDGLIVNPEQAAEAGKVGEGGPVPGEDGRGDAVGGSLVRLHQPPSRSLLSHFS